MKNSFTRALTWLIALGGQLANAYSQSDSYVFTISDESACWEKIADNKSRFEVNSKAVCSFTLQIGSDVLEITGPGFQTTYTPEAGKIKFLQAAVAKHVSLPDATGITAQLVWKVCEMPKPKTPVIIKKCESPAADGQAPAPPKTATTGFLFIPSPDDEKDLLKIADCASEASNCCPGSQELVYNFPAECPTPACRDAGCFCGNCVDLAKCQKEAIKALKRMHKKEMKALEAKYKAAPNPEQQKSETEALEKRQKEALEALKMKHKHLGSGLPFRKFHPRVGDKLRIRVVGMHPYRDSLSLSVSFSDLNKDDKAKFTAMLAKAEGAGKPSESSQKDGGDVEAGAHATQVISTVIPAFRSEMARFYQEKWAANHLCTDLLRLAVLHIQANIKTRFGIGTATPELMANKVNEWLLGNITLTNEQKKELLQSFKEGLRDYRRILDYRVSSVWVFPVKDFDLTKISFNWFSNGKPKYDTPQTFDFFNKGGFTINYSTGIAINNLVNHAFTTQAVKVLDPATMTMVTKDSVIRELSSDINIGPAVLAHAYYRPGWNHFNLGLTTGFMTNTRDNDFGLNFLFGGSLLLGSKQRLVLTAGGIIGKATRLAEGMELGKTILDPPGPGETSSVKTRDIYRTKWFVGVTYNLGN